MALSKKQARQLETLLDALAAGDAESPLEHRRLALQAHALAVAAGDLLLQAEARRSLGRYRGPVLYPADALEALRKAELVFRAHGRTADAAGCLIASARALYELGRERQATDAALSALSDPSLSPEGQAAAYRLMALCHGRLGELDTAVRLMKQQAIPLARATDDPFLPAMAQWALGIIYMMVLIRLKLPAAHRTVPNPTPVAEPAPRAERVIALFDAAQAALPPGRRWDHIQMSRLTLQGLFGAPAGAVAGLSELADRHLEEDPLLAAWAWCGQAVILLVADQADAALDVASRALAVTEPLQAHALVRDLLLLQARAYERLGEAASALAAMKRHSDLQLLGLSLGSDASGQLPTGPSPDAPSHVRRALRHIDANLGRNLTVSELAALCGVSRRTLELSFKVAIASTIAAYMKGRRLAHASEQMLSTNRSMQDVAQEVGYTSSGAFARDFRQHFGATPTDWKRGRWDAIALAP